MEIFTNILFEIFKMMYKDDIVRTFVMGLKMLCVESSTMYRHDLSDGPLIYKCDVPIQHKGYKIEMRAITTMDGVRGRLSKQFGTINLDM